MTAQIIHFQTRQPLIQDNHIGSIYFEPKSDCVSARRKTDILLSVGWSKYESNGLVVFSNPHVDDNTPYFLEDAWSVQLRREFEGRVCK